MKKANKMLWEGVKEDDFDKVRIALNFRAEVNVKDNSGWTPLHWAVDYNRLEIAQFLIPSGAELNAKDKLGQTPLHRAAVRNSLAVAELLISSGADLDAKDNRGNTPLALADWNDHQVMKTLLQGVTI